MKALNPLPVLVLLAAGCAAAPPAPRALEFSRLYLERAEAADRAPPVPAPEGAETGDAPVPVEPATGAALPRPHDPADEIRGLLAPSPVRLDELRRRAADDSALTALLAAPVTEEDLAVLAWLRAPAVAAARERVEAARNSYRQSLDLEDLVALYRSFLRDTDLRVGPDSSRRGTGAIAPSPNVTEISLEVAKRTVDMAFQDLRAVVRDTAARARRLHADAARLREARTILGEEVALDDQLVRVLRARYEAGRGSHGGVLTFESRLERLRTELAVLGEQEAALRAGWNALLDRPGDAPVTLGVDAAGPGRLPAPDGTAALVEEALANRPEFLAASLAAERAALGVRLAETMTLPRMDVGSSRFERERAGEAGVQRGAVFPAPGRMVMSRADFGVREAQVEEMRARSRSMEAVREGMRNRVRAEVQGAVFAADAAHRRASTLADEVVPRAVRALASIQAGYESDRESYLDLLDAVRRLLDARLGLADARRDLGHARALLLEAIGVETTGR